MGWYGTKIEHVDYGTATCFFCGKEVRLKKDGTLRKHVHKKNKTKDGNGR